ncbi:hypothetical protein [Novosphingobium taihuense]|uniref:hypothetical protein n=1 Tax=Novosphingobium taihuense TaxID=260085 RepID=UPI0015E889B9|nr:hypothetical protein [Novosphingobium taihuense]
MIIEKQTIAPASFIWSRLHPATRVQKAAIALRTYSARPSKFTASSSADLMPTGN